MASTKTSKALISYAGATENNFPTFPLTPNLSADISSIGSNGSHNSCESSADFEFTGLNELHDWTNPVFLPDAFDNGEAGATVTNNASAPPPPPALMTVAAPQSTIDPMLTQENETTSSVAVQPPAPASAKGKLPASEKRPSLDSWVSDLARLNTSICAYRPGYEGSGMMNLPGVTYPGESRRRGGTAGGALERPRIASTPESETADFETTFRMATELAALLQRLHIRSVPASKEQRRPQFGAALHRLGPSRADSVIGSTNMWSGRHRSHRTNHDELYGQQQSQRRHHSHQHRQHSRTQQELDPEEEDFDDEDDNDGQRRSQPTDSSDASTANAMEQNEIITEILHDAANILLLTSTYGRLLGLLSAIVYRTQAITSSPCDAITTEHSSMKRDLAAGSLNRPTLSTGTPPAVEGSTSSSLMTTNVTLGMLDLASRPAMQQFVVVNMVELLVRRVDRGLQVVMEQQQQEYEAHHSLERFHGDEELPRLGNSRPVQKRRREAGHDMMRPAGRGIGLSDIGGLGFVLDVVGERQTALLDATSELRAKLLVAVD